MFPIRLQKRACTDTGKIHRFLEQAKTGFLGLASGNVPYVVPLNFVWKDNAIYFHVASEGRKIDMIEDNPEGCFTVSEEYGTITDPTPAHIDTAYMSVILYGTIEKVTDGDEATAAMQVMLNKYVPGYFDRPLAKSHLERYVSSMGSKTSVFKLTASSITAKESEVNPPKMFYEGRKSYQDLR
ncbi:pyridoxamine 5'-phosphate oxidase family protein [Paenibacillus glycanilyticus]|uniref:pyridoxamine 5'-phosphate oxidase family protein n=1 Tax=Paenibacillus glycanilyticus TaxID=126569 RepID=UPI00203C42CE|nr:pyridoxamine 5'-phosphate oxidase family protein [Paenibacillus glycanilyticus]MCM3629048.1 pyridoxamine 5'-phosphate oxidase family protein [Paenibacillus glycanilyticus]